MPSKISNNNGVKEDEKTTPSLPLFQRPVWVACFALTAAVVWGWAYPLIKMGFEEFAITPDMTGNKILFAGVRFTFSGLIILAFAKAKRRSFAMRRKTDWWFMLLFAFLPNGHNRLRNTVPGAVLASLGWLAISQLFSLYVENFASLTNIYGSVYTLALAMLWLYCCMSIFFYGGALNRYLMEN